MLLGQAGAARNLFCVHPLYGIVGAYVPLAAALAGVARVYGIQSPIYSEPTWRAASLEGLACEYVRRMRLVQPEGPYYLLGWSLGGWVAAAMAAELEREGESVALLATVDTRAVLPSQRTDRETFARELERAAGQSVEDRVAVEREVRRANADLFETALEVLVHHEDLLSRHRIDRLRADVHVWRAARAGRRPDGTEAPPVQHGPGWQGFTSGAAHETDVDATHESIVDDERLFSDLRALLRRDPAAKP